MAKRTVDDINVDLWRTFSALNNKVTYAGEGGVLADIFKSMAYAFYEQDYELARVRRMRLIDDSSGADLDLLALEEYGLTRNGATKSSLYLIVTGLVNTIIGTSLTAQFYHKSTNEGYRVVTGLTIGANNPDLAGASGSVSFGDIILLESINSGSKTKAGSNTVTVADNKALTVFNSSPSFGGEDVESDAAFRTRIKKQNSLSSIFTNEFFNSVAMLADTNIIKAFTSYSAGVITIYVMKNSGIDFSGGELAAIKTYIDNKLPAFFNLTQSILTFTTVVANVSYLGINVEVTGAFYLTPTLLATYTSIADQIGDNYINPGILNFGDPVTDDMVYKAIIDTETSIDVELSSIRLNNSTKVIPAAHQICKVVNLSLTDTVTATTLNFALNQRPVE